MRAGLGEAGFPSITATFFDNPIFTISVTTNTPQWRSEGRDLSQRGPIQGLKCEEAPFKEGKPEQLLPAKGKRA